MFRGFERSLSATEVGASLTLITVIVNTCSVNRPPWSVPRTRIE